MNGCAKTADGDCHCYPSEMTACEHWRKKPKQSPGMTLLMTDLRRFHEACDVPIGDKPAFPAYDRILLRDRLLKEEIRELDVAHIERDLVEVADAIADCIFVLIGTALDYGIPLDRVWAEVQRTNMAKVDPTTGKVKRREDGKILKPDGWTAPDIASCLAVDSQP